MVRLYGSRHVFNGSLVPTLGIVGLMVWEYFSDEAERKAERHREIEQVVSLTFFHSVHHVMHFP